MFSLRNTKIIFELSSLPPPNWSSVEECIESKTKQTNYAMVNSGKCRSRSVMTLTLQWKYYDESLYAVISQRVFLSLRK